MEVPMQIKFLVPLAAVALAACGASGKAPAESAPPPPDQCRASTLGRYLNLLPTDDVKAGIAAQVGQRTIRYIAPGQPVTMDYRIDRLNVETGKDGRIKRLYCG